MINKIKLNKFHKKLILIFIFVIILSLSIVIPTFARYKNRIIKDELVVWDGTTANSYRSGDGSKNNPYEISNASELSYFNKQLLLTNYENTYFVLSSDIIMNDGSFTYDKNDGIRYKLGDNNYYVDVTNDNYYETLEEGKTKVGKLNSFTSLSNFKGYLNGQSYRIYGLYMNDKTSDELALFTNLEGTIDNLYVENSIINGGYLSAGIASTATNTTLNNVVFNGYVIGNNNKISKDITKDIDDQELNFSDEKQSNKISLNNINGNIIKSSLSGTCTSNSLECSNVKINGNQIKDGNFSIDLGINTMDHLLIESSQIGNITLTNLKYNVTYEYAFSSGLITTGSNIKINNCINKGYVYGMLSSSGIANNLYNKFSLNNSYNEGNIESDELSTGLIGNALNINEEANINKSYNSGYLVAPTSIGLVGNIINDNKLNINNSFNSSNVNYNILNSNNSSVNISNVYYTNGSKIKEGTLNGNLTLTNISNLKNQTFLQSTLLMNEFIDEDNLNNNENIWVFEKNELPILYIDDEKNPIVSIHVGNHSWSNYSNSINTIKSNSLVKFSVEENDKLNPVKELYYFINKSNNILSKEQLSNLNSWVTYDGIEEIKDEGFYTIYVKAIDYNDNITYLNTDLLLIDLSGANVSIKMEDNEWKTLTDNLNYVYLDEQKNISISANDDLSGVSSIKYFISDDKMNKSELDNLEDNKWINYTNEVLIGDSESKIIYTKVTDNCGYISYANSDYIELNGYINSSYKVGNIQETNDEINISDKSIISFDTLYKNSNGYSNYTHAIESNTLLPKNTTIIIIDNNSKDVYKYTIPSDEDLYDYENSCNQNDSSCIKQARYPFKMFTKVGIGDTKKYFSDDDYYKDSNIDEKFKIILDFSKNITNKNYYNVILNTLLLDSKNNTVIKTLKNSNKTINIYANTNSSLSLISNFKDSINLNSDSDSYVDLNSIINYKYYNKEKINDSTYNDMGIALSIKLVDKENNLISKKKYKNVMFKIDDNEYYPDSDNITRINISNTLDNINKTLLIKTVTDNNKLEDGTYYFKITNYYSYNNLFNESFKGSEVTIPAIVSNSDVTNYDFNVYMEDKDKILLRNSNNIVVPFSILQSGNLSNPNIVVSLYKKSQLTAYNQDYGIIDLSKYTTNTLNKKDDNFYYLLSNPIKYNGKKETYNNVNLNFNTNLFDKGAYKLTFQLYDGQKKVGSLDRKFIIR